MGGESWRNVVSKHSKKSAKQAETIDAITEQYDIYLHDCEVEDADAEKEVDNLLKSDDLPERTADPHEKLTPNSEARLLQPNSQTEGRTDMVFMHRSPWMRKAQHFYDEPTFTKEDLHIPHYKNISPKDDIIQLDESDMVPIRKGWGLCLLGMFAGRFPGKEAVFQLMKRWPVKARVTFHRKGWMFFQFGTEQDMERTRQKGPFSVFGIPLILQPMPEDFRLSKEMEINIPVWIKLVDLEPIFWTESTIGKIASNIGVPLATDFRTLEKGAMDWPRIQVIINAASTTKEEVILRSHKGEVFVQKLEFEYLPKYCTTCKVFGHYTHGCPGPDARSRNTLRGSQQGRTNGMARNRSKSVAPKPTGRQASSRQPSRTRQPSKARMPSQPPQWRTTGNSVTYPISGTYRRTPADPRDYKGAAKGALGSEPSTSNRFAVLEVPILPDPSTNPPKMAPVERGAEIQACHPETHTETRRQGIQPQNDTENEPLQRQECEMDAVLLNHYIVEPPSNSSLHPSAPTPRAQKAKQVVQGPTKMAPVDDQPKPTATTENETQDCPNRNVEVVIALPAKKKKKAAMITNDSTLTKERKGKRERITIRKKKKDASTLPPLDPGDGPSKIISTSE